MNMTGEYSGNDMRAAEAFQYFSGSCFLLQHVEKPGRNAWNSARFY
jgi:hypothetical protein